MNRRGAVVGVTLTADLVFGAVPVQSALTWNVDLETGAEWRKMTDSELATVGWPNQKGWITKNYGDLSKFRTNSNVTINAAYDGDVHTLDFGIRETVEQLLATIEILPVGAVTDPLPVPTSDSMRRYDGPGTWFAAHTNSTDQFSASGEQDGAEVWMWGPHPDLDLTTDDYVYVIKMACTVTTSDGDGGGGKFDTTAPTEGCLDVGDPGTPDESVPLTFSMLGEIEWCQSDAHKDDWATDMDNVFDEIDASHRDTHAEPEVAWKACWVMASGYTYDHSEDWYVHAHDSDDTPQHPWAFNNVGTGTNTHGSGVGDDSYLNAKIVLNGNDRPNVYENRGVEASEEHLAEEHPNNDFVDADITVLMHRAALLQGEAGGYAWEPGESNVVTDDRAATVEAQETGHNLNANHCAASSRTNSAGNVVYTLMANPNDRDCDQSDLDYYENVFSDANINNVNNCLGDGTDPCFK